MPGTAVWIGRNGPRYSIGAAGLGSKVSNWLGPPHIQKRMTEVSGGVDAVWARSSSGMCQPPRAKAPRRTKARRDSGPGQGFNIMVSQAECGTDGSADGPER